MERRFSGREELAILHKHLVGLAASSSDSTVLDLALDLLATARVVVVVLSPDRRIRYVNPFFEGLTGFALDELVDRNWFEACVPEHAGESLEPVFDKAINGVPTVGHTNPIATRDGGERLIKWFDRAFRDADGSIVALLAIGHDVTEQVHAARELQRANCELEARVTTHTNELAKSEERYRGLLEGLSECVYRMLLPEGVYDYMSPAAEAVFGYPAAKFLAEPKFIASIIADDYQGYFRERLRELIAGQVPPTYEYRIRLADGKERWILQTNRRIYDESGKIKAIEGICRDVTTLHTTREALEKSHQLLEGSFDASTVALAYLDRDMRFLRVNQVYADADGHDPSWFVGKGHFELFPHADNELIFYRVRDTGVAHSELAKPFEYKYNPDRGVTHWDWTLTPVTGADGTVTGLVLALRDVTARIKAIEAVRDSEARLARELSEKEILLQEMHHRVKNNLQVISSLLYLQGERVVDSTVREALSESRDRIRAMALVHETLYSSANLSTLELGQYLQALCDALSSSYARRDLEVAVTVSADAVPIDMATAVPCGLIASELVTNSLKYAFLGRREGAITVSLRRLGGRRLCLEVCDDGVGVDVTALRESNTLGVRLVRLLSQQLGGEMEVTKVSCGTCLRVSFLEPSSELESEDQSGTI